MNYRPETMLQLVELSKSFSGGKIPAVHDLSFEIERGEFFTLLGPSGCGKTTILRLVAGLDIPDRGAIFYHGRPLVVTNQRLFVPAQKRNIGMVFQSYALWPHMTVAENIAFPLRVRKLGRQAIQARVEQVLALVGLQELASRPVPALSGGQQQRVALARALVYEPELLLLDEPFSNLDATLRDQMRLELQTLQQRLGVTVLFVTHDQYEALSLSSRIAVLRAGHLQQIGPPRMLYEAPANAFVRDFLGKVVLLNGRIQAHGVPGAMAVALEGDEGCLLPLPMSEGAALSEGSRVVVAVRPEDFSLSPWDSTSATHDTLRGTIEAAVFVGDRMEYYLQIAKHGRVLVYGDRHTLFHTGQSVRIKPNPQGLRLWAIDQQGWAQNRAAVFLEP